MRLRARRNIIILLGDRRTHMNWRTKARILVLAVFILTLGVGCKPGYVRHTEQFAAQVKSAVNPDELQAWATNIIAKTRIVDQSPVVYLKAEDVPAFVRAVYKNEDSLPDVEVINSNGDSWVEICYGSGLGHWGLFVGSPTLEQKSTEAFYILPWKPRIYFWNGP